LFWAGGVASAVRLQGPRDFSVQGKGDLWDYLRKT